MGQSQQMVDMRGRLFQLSLGELFNQMWSLYLQFDKVNLLKYTWEGQSRTIDPALLETLYQVKPSGSADNVNKAFVMQKAIARQQLFGGKPWINQIELDKTILVQRLIIDPQDRQRNEAEEQAKETLILLEGRSLGINPDDDHVTHLNELVQYVQGVLSRPNPEDQVIHGYGASKVLEHGQMHLQAIQQTKGGQQLMQGVDQKALGFVTGYLQRLVEQEMASAAPMPMANQGVAV
jgi:hypothetical protein